MKKPPILFLLIVLLTAAVGYAGFKAWEQSLPPLHPEHAVFRLTNGQKLSVADFHGRPLLVNFWQSHCQPCREEMPHLADLYRELSPRGFAVIGVVMYYDRPDRALAVAKKMNLPYPIAIDIEASVAKAFGDVGPTPTSFLIAPDGSVALRRNGKVPVKKLRKQVLAMLAPP